MTAQDREKYEQGMNELYKQYVDDIENNNEESLIYSIFLNSKTSNYLDNTSTKRQVIDFISGMTDELFINESEKILEKKRKM